MFARLLLIPPILLALIGLYFSWNYYEGFIWMIVTGVVLTATILVLNPQINWRYYKRFPPDVEPEIKKMVLEKDAFYLRLSVSDQVRFRQRMALFILGTEFIPAGIERVPHDVEAIVAAAATKVRWYQKEPIFKSCQRVVIYLHPFPSPDWPEHWHHSEWHSEDGVVLFSADALYRHLLHPGSVYDPALYEYLKVHRFESRQDAFRIPDVWAMIHQLNGWTAEQIKEMIGLPQVDADMFYTGLWFDHMARLESSMPEEVNMIQSFLKKEGEKNQC